MLVAAGPDTWHVAEVRTGEMSAARIEILRGLQAGEQVIGAGAILLKPLVVEAVQSADKPAEETPARREPSP